MFGQPLFLSIFIHTARPFVIAGIDIGDDFVWVDLDCDDWFVYFEQVVPLVAFEPNFDGKHSSLLLPVLIGDFQQYWHGEQSVFRRSEPKHHQHNLMML